LENTEQVFNAVKMFPLLAGRGIPQFARLPRPQVAGPQIAGVAIPQTTGQIAVWDLTIQCLSGIKFYHIS